MSKKSNKSKSVQPEQEEKITEVSPELEEESAEETADSNNDLTENSAEEAAENTVETEEDSSEEDSENSDDEETEKKSKKKIDPEKEAKKAEKKAIRKDKRALKARAFKRGWFSVALVAFFVAGVILINLIASTLVEKVPALVIDTSGSDNFELTEETLSYISDLQDNIKIIVLSEEKEYTEGGEYFVQANKLFHEYENHSDKITLQYVDLSSDPTFASAYPDESLNYYSVIVQGDKGYKYITQNEYFDVQIDYNTYQYYIAGSKVEEEITSAILNVTLDDKPKVTFVSGISDNDYSYFKSFLEKNGFETEEVSPAMKSIPEDTEILVLYTPNTDLESDFVDKISEFLTNSGSYGKQFLYVPSEKMFSLPNIDSLLEEWGMSIEQGYAIENDTGYMAQIAQGVYLFAAQYPDATYTENMKNKTLPFCVVGGYTLPVNILDTENAKPLFTLSDKSEILYSTETGDEPDYESSPNVTVGAISSKGKDGDESAENTSNVIVIGSSVSLSNTFMQSGVYGNSGYMLSLLNTISDRENVGVSIETKSLKSAELGITTAQQRVLSLIFVVIVPVAILAVGIIIFIRRRNM